MLFAKKKYLYRESKTTPEKRAEYKLLCQEIKAKVKEYRKKTEIRLSKKSQKSLLKFVSNVSKQTSEIPPLSCAAGNICFTDIQKGEAFLAQFSQNFVPSELSDIEVCDEPFPKSKKCEIQFDPHILVNHLLKLPNKATFSLEGINHYLMKKLSIPLALPSSLLFKESFESGAIPSQWKISVIVPVHKKGPRSNPENYRPISLTSPICRLFERVIAYNMRHHYFQSIISEQFGFMPKKSCPLALLNSLTDINVTLAQKRSVDIIFFDFRLAFDRVNHNLLLRKLFSFGIDPIIVRWYKNFLSSRTAVIKINDCITKRNFDIHTGVLQGTVSGPLLFLIFINDIATFFPEEVKFSLYADDLKIYSTNPVALQLAIDMVIEWSETWQLPLAIHKTMVLHCGKKNDKYDYKMSNTLITKVDCVKDLGLHYDGSLNFEHHINCKVTLAVLKCKQLLSTFRYLDLPDYITLFKTFVMPILEYCCEIFSPSHNSKHVELLEKPLRFFTQKIMRRKGIAYNSYSERLEECSMVSLFQRRIMKDVLLCRDILLLPNFDHPLLFSRSVRLCNNLNVPYDNYYISNWFYRRVVHYWNKIDVSVLSTSREQLKQQALRHSIQYFGQVPRFLMH
jgi:hypothetical protein